MVRAQWFVLTAIILDLGTIPTTAAINPVCACSSHPCGDPIKIDVSVRPHTIGEQLKDSS